MNKISHHAGRGEVFAVRYYKERPNTSMSWETFRASSDGRNWLAKQVAPYREKLIIGGMDADYSIGRAYAQQAQLILKHGEAAFGLAQYAKLEIIVYILNEIKYCGA